MSSLNNTDSLLLNRLKAEIEKISGLRSAGELTQKDYDFLIYYIEEKTGNRLSLTTIKRIWKSEFQRLPHLSTLDMLSQLAYQVNWMTLKKNFIEEQAVPDTDTVVSETSHGKKDKAKLPMKLLVPVTVAVLLGLVWLFTSWYTPIDASKVTFSAKATADGKIPNTVVFSYDVSSVNAEKFFIQQSWDPLKKVQVAKESKKQTDIYYDPGYHYAKLIADDKVIKQIPVHVKCDDWYVRLRYPDGEVKRVGEEWLNRTGALSIRREYFIQADTKPQHDYSLGYMLSKDFNISADELEFSSRFRVDSVSAQACPAVALLIKGDKDYIYINFANKGCESNLGYRCSDTSVSGKTNDLSDFGVDIFNWQTVALTVSGKKASVMLNGKVIREIPYTQQLGELKEVDFLFNSAGTIDEVMMRGKGRSTAYFGFQAH